MQTHQNGTGIGSQILLDRGLPQLPFGTLREDVLALLGQPDDVDRYSDEDDFASETWHYDDLELSLVIEEIEDWRLTTFTVSSANFTLNNTHLIGLTREELEEQIELLELGEVYFDDWSDEEEGENLTMLSLPDNNLNFWLFDGLLSEIQWGVPYNDDDEAIWPG